MSAPAGSYGHVQWHGGGVNFGGEANLRYNGCLFVASPTTDVGVQYKVQSGDSIYAAKNVYVGQNIKVTRKIRRNSVVAGTIYPIWAYNASGSILTDYTAANFRTAANIYVTTDVDTRAAMDTRYQRASLMSSYYRKTETLPRTNVYARSEVYMKAEVLSLLAGYIARTVATSTLANYAASTHRHVVALDPNDLHNHTGATTDESGHIHPTSISTPINI